MSRGLLSACGPTQAPKHLPRHYSASTLPSDKEIFDFKWFREFIPPQLRAGNIKILARLSYTSHRIASVKNPNWCFLKCSRFSPVHFWLFSSRRYRYFKNYQMWVQLETFSWYFAWIMVSGSRRLFRWVKSTPARIPVPGTCRGEKSETKRFFFVMS